MDHPPGEPVLKVCYFRYYSWFAEIDPVKLQFNTSILSIRCLAGLCVNQKQKQNVGFAVLCRMPGRWLYTSQLKRSFWSHRRWWKILTSFCIRCNVADGIYLAQGACKLRFIVRSLHNERCCCTCWVTACFTRRQICEMDGEIIHWFVAKESLLSSTNYRDNVWGQPILMLICVQD